MTLQSLIIAYPLPELTLQLIFFVVVVTFKS